MAQEFRMDSAHVGALVDGLAGLSARMSGQVSWYPCRRSGSASTSICTSPPGI